MGMYLNESELPSDELLRFYVVYEDVMLSFTFIMVIGSIFVMVKSSPHTMSIYRWYLVHELVWSLLFDVFGSLIGAVTLLPLPCYYGVNRANNFTEASQTFYLFAGVSAVIGKCVGIFLELAYRFAQTMPPDAKLTVIRWDHWSLRRQLLLFAGTFVFFETIVMIPFAVWYPDSAGVRQFFVDNDPTVAELYRRNPSITCFAGVGGLGRVLAGAALSISLVPIVAGYTLVLMYVYIRQARALVHTYRLQMMLFWSLVAQELAALFFLVIPGVIYLFAPLVGVRNMPRIGIYCFMAFLAHTPVDCIMIIAFIRPYRVFILRILPSNTSSVSPPQLYPPTTSYHSNSPEIRHSLGLLPAERVSRHEQEPLHV